MSVQRSDQLREISKIAKAEDGICGFVGAGCSAALKIPLWKEMLVGLNEQFGCYGSKEEVIKDIDLIGYTKVASKIHAVAQDDKAYQDAMKRFSTPAACYFTSLHLELLILSMTIVTTNYDTSFEDALELLKRLGNPGQWDYVKSTQPKFKLTGIGTKRHILHLHGDKNSSNMVITDEAYAENYDNMLSGVPHLIKLTFSQLSTIFVGFSFEDEAFVRLLKKIDLVTQLENQRSGSDRLKHYCILGDENLKDFITESELKFIGLKIQKLLDNGIIEERGYLENGEKKFYPLNTASSRISVLGMADKEKEEMVTLIKQTIDRYEKLTMLKDLNIEVITFKKGNYIEIEHILSEINQPLSSVAPQFEP